MPENEPSAIPVALGTLAMSYEDMIGYRRLIAAARKRIDKGEDPIKVRDDEFARADRGMLLRTGLAEPTDEERAEMAAAAEVEAEEQRQREVEHAGRLHRFRARLTDATCGNLLAEAVLTLHRAVAESGVSRDCCAECSGGDSPEEWPCATVGAIAEFYDIEIP